MSLNFTWQNVWSFCQNASKEARHELFKGAAQAIVSMTAEEQIKALEGAPEEFINGIQPYLKPEARKTKPFIEPFNTEDWKLATERWKQIKEKR